MSRQFNSCKGKTLCIENETECRTCGRSIDEIYTTRRLIDELSNFIVDMDYDNVSEFMHYMIKKVAKKVDYLETQKQQTTSSGYH